MSVPTVVTVAADTPYDVVIGHDITSRVVDMIRADSARVALIHAPVMTELANTLGRHVAASGREVVLIAVPDAEAAKTAIVAADCWAALGKANFTRSDVVVGVGGGATTDLAGFVAATWLRGVDHIEIPTTMLGMVDAAVGGKTGINTGEGKNLVGSFHPPVGVVCDLERLLTLPVADYVAGLAEVVKCGFIADDVILGLIEANPADVCLAGNGAEAELVQRAVQVKADVVGHDLREATTASAASVSPISGLPQVTGREMLNYGHTFAHAIELAEHYRWRHGDAVSVGMVFAAEVSARSGIADSVLVQRHRDVLGSLGLPIIYADAEWSVLREAIGRDKKARGATVRFIGLDAVASPVLLSGVAEEILVDAYAAVAP